MYAGLTREVPQRVSFRGMVVLADARLGARGLERRLEDGPVDDRSVLAFYRARLAAVEGNGERAAAILADAVRTGVDDLSWLHGSAYADLVLLRDRRESLPPALRVPVPSGGGR